MRYLATALVGLTACSAEVVEIPVPTEADTQSVLLGIVTENQRTLTALDVQDPSPALPGFARFDQPARFFALLYDRPLSALGLAPGIHAHDPVGGRLPTPGSTYERSARPGAAGAWTLVPGLDPELEIRLREIDALAHCPRLDVRVLETPLVKRVLAAVVVEDRVFALGLEGRAIWVDENGVEDAPGAWPPDVLAATRTTTGAIWLADSAGQLFVGTPQDGFQLHSRRDVGGGIRYLATPSDPEAPFELFALSRTGVLERFADGVWTTIELGLPVDGSDRLGDLLWLAPGEVAAVAPHSSRLSLVRGDHVETTTVDPVVHSDLSSLARLDGTLYGSTGIGDLLRFERGTYAKVASFPQLEATYDIIPYGGGILLPGTFLDLRTYIPGEDPCPGSGQTALNHSIWTTVRWGTKIVGFTSPEEGWDEGPTMKALVIEAVE